MWKLFRPVVDFVEELGLPNQLAVYRSALDKHHVFVERCRLDPRRSFTFRWQTSISRAAALANISPVLRSEG